MSELWRVSFVIDADSVTEILKVMTDKVADLQIHPIEPVRRARALLNRGMTKRGRPRKIIRPTLRPGSAKDLTLALIKRHKGGVVKTGQILQMLKRHNKHGHTQGMGDLVALGLVKQPARGEYVYTGGE